jgi:flagellar capping protein FliD
LSVLGRDLIRHDESIQTMTLTLQRREAHFYNMFGRMEAAMMRADSQMQALLQSLGGFM